MRILFDPLFRRFFLGTLFTGAFVWVAVRYFDVPTEVVWVVFVFSLGFVAMAIGVGVVAALGYRIWRHYRRADGLVDRLSRGEAPRDKDFSQARTTAEDTPPP